MTAGVAGAGVVIARELASLFRLKSVEAIHQRLAGERVVRPRDARKVIADVLAVVPRERETEAAIEDFQRQVQLHHTTAQQVDDAVAYGDEAARPPRRSACAHRRAARLRHHRDQPDGA